MSRLEYIPPFTRARIKVGYVTWYRQKHNIRSDKYPILRDGMIVYLVNEHDLKDRYRRNLVHCWSVVTTDMKNAAVIPSTLLEIVKPTSI